jgi:hypothetical protein
MGPLPNYCQKILKIENSRKVVCFLISINLKEVAYFLKIKVRGYSAE